MPAMTKEQMDEFLQGPHLARIATVKQDGSPHVVPVWYDWDGQTLYVVARKYSAWVDHVRREPRVAVVIDDQSPTLPKVVIEGEAHIEGSDWLEIGKRMVVRYFGPELGPKYLQGTIDQPRWVVKIIPQRITTWFIPQEAAGGRQSWHHRYYVPGTKWYEEFIRERAAGR